VEAGASTIPAALAGNPMSWWEMGFAALILGWVPVAIGWHLLRVLLDVVHDVGAKWRRSGRGWLLLGVNRIGNFVRSRFEERSQRVAMVATAVFLLYAFVERPRYGGRLYGLLGIPQVFTKIGWAAGAWLGYSSGPFGFVQFAASALAVYVFVRMGFWCFGSRRLQGQREKSAKAAAGA